MKVSRTFLCTDKDGLGNFAFVDQSGSFNIPFDFSSTRARREDLKLEDLFTARGSIPKEIGVEQPMSTQVVRWLPIMKPTDLKAAENINALAFATLRG